MSELMEIPKIYTVTNMEEFESASSLLVEWKEELKRIDADEKAITAPINKSLKEIRAKYKPIKERCEQVITNLRNSLNEYKRIEEAKREADRKALEELAKDGADLGTLVELVDESPSLGGRLTTVVSASPTSISSEYAIDLLTRVWDTAMVVVRKDVAVGRIEAGVIVTKEKKI